MSDRVINIIGIIIIPIVALIVEIIGNIILPIRLASRSSSTKTNKPTSPNIKRVTIFMVALIIIGTIIWVASRSSDKNTDESVNLDTETVIISEEDVIEEAQKCLNQVINLYKKNLSKAEDAIADLKKLVDEHPKNDEVAACYAEALFNLSSEQDLSGRESTVTILKQLADDHPKNEIFTVWYAKGLVNLSFKQDLPGVENTVAILKKLADKHPKNEEFVVCYAKGLHFLSLLQDLSGVKDTLKVLEKLKNKYPDNVDIPSYNKLVQSRLRSLQNAQS